MTPNARERAKIKDWATIMVEGMFGGKPNSLDQFIASEFLTLESELAEANARAERAEAVVAAAKSLCMELKPTMEKRLNCFQIPLLEDLMEALDALKEKA